MPKISKPFVIATEGPTIDGRNISRDWLTQMAVNYDPKAYTAVANLEHLLSLSPDSLFSAYGKVVKLGTQEALILGEKKLQLTAVVEVDDAVVAMQKAGKKLFASMEVVANFAGKGVAYLTGLAFTDTPASLGTESMKFSAGKDGIYSFATGLEITFDDPPGEGESLIAKVKALLTGKDKQADARFADTGQAVEALAASQRDLLDRFVALTGQANTAQTAAEKAAADLAAFAARLDGTPAAAPRPPAAGGNGQHATDC